LTNSYYLNIRTSQRPAIQNPEPGVAQNILQRSGLLFCTEVKMHDVKSREGRWSVSLCNCSQDTAHVHYGNVVLHILRDDLRELGLAMQSVAEGIEQRDGQNFSALKEGLVQ